MIPLEPPPAPPRWMPAKEAAERSAIAWRSILLERLPLLDRFMPPGMLARMLANPRTTPDLILNICDSIDAALKLDTASPADDGPTLCTLAELLRLEARRRADLPSQPLEETQG